MFRLFRRLQPDLVHTHTAKAGAVGRVAGILYRATTRRRCRFIHTYHGHVFHSYYGALKTRLFLSVERALARFATDRIVVLSPQQLHEIHTVFRIGRREQFTIVPLGIDLQSVSTSAAQRTQLRADLGISEKEALVGIVGRLAPIKNHDLFLRVARRLGNGVRFVIFGDGSEKPSIERSIDELQVRDRVSFAGVRDPAEIYSAADVIALTSLNEGTPLALIEAMAAGVPIVSTSVGGVVDLLGAVTASIDEQNARYEIRQRGITAASTDDAGFAAGLQRLLSDDRLRSTVARDAKEYVAKNYSKDRLVADIIRLTRELAAEPAQ
jgi:glycosyltransferase involved in cell wall biosynthesis